MAIADQPQGVLPIRKRKQDILNSSKNMLFELDLVVIENDDDGFFAHCPQVPNVVAGGDTADETASNLEDALKCHLSFLIHMGKKLPVEPVFKEPDTVRTIHTAITVAA